MRYISGFTNQEEPPCLQEVAWETVQEYYGK